MPYNLENLGAQIDEVDTLLVALLAYRMGLSLRIGLLKKANGQSAFRPEVEDLRLAKAVGMAKKLGLNPNFAFSTMYGVISESRAQQIIKLRGDDLPGLESDELYRILDRGLMCLNEHVAPMRP